MAKFGQFPARSPNTFGVAGLLHEKCKVYYDTIFTARHIGRVSDLLNARLKDLNPDELRFRIIMMFSLYEGYRGHLRALGKPDGDSLPEPLLIECGVDGEKIAVGVSFAYAQDEMPDPQGLPVRIGAGGASNRLEAFIAQVYADADQVVVRIQPDTRRLEIVSMIGLPGKIDAAQLKERRAVELLILGPDSTVGSVQADYIELGDLDYNRLLKEDGPGAAVDKPATGEILAKAAEETQESARIGGDGSTKEEVTRISGVTEHMNANADEVRVKRIGKAGGEAGDASAGNSQDELAAEEALLNQEPQGNPEADLETAKKQLELYRSRIGQLQTKIEILEGKRQNEMILVRERSVNPATAQSDETTGPETAEASGEAPIPAKPDLVPSITEIIKNFFTRKKDKAESEQSDSAPAIAKADAAPMEEALPDELGDPVTGKILRAQVEHLEETIEKMRRESQSLKNDATNARAKKWADGMVGELLAEKARINDMGKKLNVSFRQKQLEFKNKETVLREELRRKEEQLRQKTYALDRSREQGSQMNVTIERTRTQHQGGSEESQMRQKLGFTQKLLQNEKNDNIQLIRKVEELKDQLMVAQSTSVSKPRGLGDADLATMKTRFDRLSKQNDEFKRANQLLAEKLNEIQKPKPGSMSNDELRKKLETAMRLAANYQRDGDQFRIKVEELQKQETRLKGELNRANNTVRAMKASATARGQKPGDDSDDGQAA